MKIALLILLLLTSVVRAEDLVVQDDPIPPPHFLEIFTNLPSDMITWWKDTFNKDNIPELVGVLGSTAILIPTDYQTWQAVYRMSQENGNVKGFFKDSEMMSEGIFQVATSAVFLAWGATGNTRALRTAYQIGEGILSSGIVVQVMKRATGRESPKSSYSQGGKFQGYPGEKTYTASLRDYDAMPSGHLSSAFVIFEVVRRNYPEQKWMPWVGYPVMGIFALGCVGNNIHWFSDFPIAIALSYSFARIVTDRNHHGHTDISGPDSTPEMGTRWFDPLVMVNQSQLTGEPILAAGWKF